MLPVAAILTAATVAHFSQERAMETAVASYVQDLAESVAYRLDNAIHPWNFTGEFQSHNRILLWGPTMPGWIAYVNNEGKIILSSPGGELIADIWRRNIPVGAAVRVRDKENHQYTMAAYPVEQGQGYVIAVISWDRLLGRLVKVGRLWPFLIVLISLGSFWAIRLLWHRLIAPLKGLASEINDLRIGVDLPKAVYPHAVKEIESVHSALTRFAKAAIDRDNLRNRYVRDIVQVQEAERLDMAREIHDGPLQDITALLQQVHMSLEEGEDIRKRVKNTERLAKIVVRELRGLCDELAPPWMDLGLSQAMTELAERLSQNYDIHVSVDIDDSFELGSERILSLLRIFQEAVSNAVRHGNATEVCGSMYKDGDRLLFEIKDNGKGFDAGIDHEALRLEGHRGLANITERMSLMGGSLEVHSAEGNGTRILCVWNRSSLA
jgi:signal transduction histidine kinase